MNDKEVIYSKRSALNLIEVAKSTGPPFKGRPVLYLNRESELYSIYPDKNFSIPNCWNIASVMPFINNAKMVLLLGLGPGTMLTKLRYFYSELTFDAVEIDPEIVEVGYKYFDLKKDSKVRIFIADAREFLESTDNSYDLVIMDVSKKEGIPAHLCTYEFFKLIYSHLNRQGILFFNLIYDPIYGQNTRSIGKTASRIFPSVFLMRHPSLLFAFKERIFLWRLKKHLMNINHHPELAVLKEWTILHLKKFHWRITDKIFFDEKRKRLS